MPTDNIRVLPGVLRVDLDKDVPVERVLKSAMDAGLRDVVVIGRQLDGTIAAWGTQADIDASIGLLMRGVNWLAKAMQVPCPDDEGE